MKVGLFLVHGHFDVDCGCEILRTLPLILLKQLHLVDIEFGRLILFGLILVICMPGVLILTGWGLLVRRLISFVITRVIWIGCGVASRFEVMVVPGSRGLIPPLVLLGIAVPETCSHWSNKLNDYMCTV